MAAAAESKPADAAKVEFFEKRIRPVLVERCWTCHASDSKKPNGGLRLDSRATLLRGGDSGPAVSLDMPLASLLLEAIAYSGSISEMPPDGKLPDSVIAEFRQWIADGAVFPGGDSSPSDHPRKVDLEAGRRFWSFQPLGRRTPADPRQREDLRGPLDAFILGQLESQGLAPAPLASPRVLFRRLSFSLRGLPPTAEEWSEFEQGAERLPVDWLLRWSERWLASPRYGERWGRSWMDVARYAEDNPTSESTCGAPRFPYRYRDWVINAWNQDVPYDEMVRRQLAADRMDLPSTEIAALGFLGLSPVYHKEPKLSADVIATIVADEWDERIDTVTRGFLGLTVACARCHDHKFDPIRTEDYYALAGVMASTQLVEWPLEPLDPTAAEALTEVQRSIVDAQLRFDYAKKIRDTAKLEGKELAPFEEDVRRREDELKRWKETPLFTGAIANAVRDAGLWLDGSDSSWTWLDYRPGQARDLPVFIRGNANRPGAVTPRRFLEVLSPRSATPFPASTSGRREMAEAIVTSGGPLAARVIVNRVWGWQFGQGLSRTPSNFGLLGDAPSHPELLDDLAARFVASGWSLKWLQRELVASSTWQRASEAAAKPLAMKPLAAKDGERRLEAARVVDSDNRWLAHRTRWRLEPEAWRDAALSVAGQLDLTMDGPSGNLDDAAFRRRTVYGAVSRQKPASLLKLFDFPDAKQHGERRVPTVTPLQHLFLLNSPFVQQAAETLARRAMEAEPRSIQKRVEWMFATILQRAPTDVELRESATLVGEPWDGEATVDPPGPIASPAWTLLAHALLATNEFLYVD